MDLAELQRRVDKVAKIDLQPLWIAYSARVGARADIDGFLAYLGQTRAVDAAMLKELHAAASSVEITRPTDAAAWASTLGGGWQSVGPAPQKNPRASHADATLPAPTTAGPGSQAGPTTQRFEPISVLGEGAMGSVSIARDVHLRRKVALKTVLPEMSKNPEALARFVAEMQVTAQLDHPNIVPVYGLEASAAGTVGYAMKLVRGLDLDMLFVETRALLEAGKPLDAEHRLQKRLEHFLKVCDAVEFAHAKGVVHRDLKPANVMIGAHNEVYLMDWGIARLMGSGDKAFEAGIVIGDQPDMRRQGDTARTVIGSAIGTPSYMSPEQAAGRHEDLDARSDEYALGLILQECVTLVRAVEGKSLQEVLSKALLGRRDAIPQGTWHPAMPREIAAIVEKATRHAPEQRYPSVRALADDVRRYVNGDPVSVLPEGALRKSGRWLAKHRMATVAIVLGLGLSGSVATIGSLVLGQARVNAAHAKEMRVREMQAESAIEAQLVTKELTRYEAALTEFVGAAEIALMRTPPGNGEDIVGWQPPYFEDSFAGNDDAPADLGPSSRYGKPVSVLVPVSLVSEGEKGSRDPLLRSLGWLAPAFPRLFIESSGADPYRMTPAQRRATIAEEGVPAFRAVVALKDGVTLSYPGMAAADTDAARVEASLKLVFGTTGVKWGTAIAGKGGAVLPASVALYDDAGAFRGVVMLDVSMDRLLQKGGNKLGYVQSRYLIGRDGKIVSDDSPSGKHAPLAPEVLAAIARGESGTEDHAVEGHSYQYAYYPLASLDWYYVAVSEVDTMVSSTEKAETSDPRRPNTPATARPRATPPPAAASAAPVAAPPPVVDAGAPEPVDAGPPEVVDAGLPPSRQPWPKKPAAAPSSDALPPNPFDPWQVYRKKKKH